MSEGLGFDGLNLRPFPDCHRCKDEAIETGALMPFDFEVVRTFLCRDCGNKRCPKATDHRLNCTRSNEPGQTGSIYA